MSNTLVSRSRLWRSQTMGTRIQGFVQILGTDQTPTRDSSRTGDGGAVEYGEGKRDQRAERIGEGTRYAVIALSPSHSPTDTCSGCPIFPTAEDVQKFEEAVVSGKPFRTLRDSRSKSKGKVEEDDVHDEESISESEGETPSGKPKHRVCPGPSFPFLSDCSWTRFFFRTQQGASWHSWQIRAIVIEHKPSALTLWSLARGIYVGGTTIFSALHV